MSVAKSNTRLSRQRFWIALSVFAVLFFAVAVFVVRYSERTTPETEALIEAVNMGLQSFDIAPHKLNGRRVTVPPGVTGQFHMGNCTITVGTSSYLIQPDDEPARFLPLPLTSSRFHTGSAHGVIQSMDVGLQGRRFTVAGTYMYSTTPEVMPPGVIAKNVLVGDAQTLLEAGADPNALDTLQPMPPLPSSGTPLDWVNPLRLYNDWRRRNDGGYRRDPLLITAVHRAYFAPPTVITALLAHGADPNQRGRWNLTALHFAAGNGLAEVVKVLLNAGADPTLRDHTGRTPRGLAATVVAAISRIPLPPGPSSSMGTPAKFPGKKSYLVADYPAVEKLLVDAEARWAKTHPAK